MIDLRAHNFVHVKTSLRARCMHARNRAHNLSSPSFNFLVGGHLTDDGIFENLDMSPPPLLQPSFMGKLSPLPAEMGMFNNQ